MYLIPYFIFLLNYLYTNETCNNCGYEGFNTFVCFDEHHNKFHYCSVSTGRFTTMTDISECKIENERLYLKGFTFLGIPSKDTSYTLLKDVYILKVLKQGRKKKKKGIKLGTIEVLDTLGVTNMQGNFNIEVDIDKRYGIIFYHKERGGGLLDTHMFIKESEE